MDALIKCFLVLCLLSLILYNILHNNTKSWKWCCDQSRIILYSFLFEIWELFKNTSRLKLRKKRKIFLLIWSCSSEMAEAKWDMSDELVWSWNIIAEDQPIVLPLTLLVMEAVDNCCWSDIFSITSTKMKEFLNNCVLWKIFYVEVYEIWC